METKEDTYVVVLAAGYATRLMPLSKRIPKPLLEIDGTPIINRIISNFKDSGFTRFCVLIGYKMDIVKEEVLKIEEIEVIFVEQNEIMGMADAISLSVKFINENKDNITKFFISAADVIFSHEKILEMYSRLINSHADMVLSLMISKDPEIAKGHGNVKVLIDSNRAKNGEISQFFKITDIVEKPKPHQILSNYYSLPLYLFNQKVVKHLENVEISERGEKEFQDAIKNTIIAGDNVQGILVINTLINEDTIGKYHLTNLKDLIKMNKRFLSGVNLKKFNDKSPEFFKPISVKVGVEIGHKVIFGSYVIIGNYCKIDDFCELSDVIIFDNVLIGKSCKLNWCIVDEHVILPNNFHAKDCFITLKNNNKLDIDIIYFKL